MSFLSKLWDGARNVVGGVVKTAGAVVGKVIPGADAITNVLGGIIQRESPEQKAANDAYNQQLQAQKAANDEQIRANEIMLQQQANAKAKAANTPPPFPTVGTGSFLDTLKKYWYLFLGGAVTLGLIIWLLVRKTSTRKRY